MNIRFFNLHIIFVFLFITGVLMHCQGFLTNLMADGGQKEENRIKITIRETNSVNGSHVFLGEIADIRAEGFLKETLGKIDLGMSPKPDKIKSIDKKKIVSAIQGERYLPKDIVITCPDRIYVKRLSREASPQDLRKYVEKRFSEIFKNKEYQLITFNVKGIRPYPDKDITFFSDSMDLVDKKGKFSFFVDIVVDGKKIDKVRVSGLVARYETVLFAKSSHEKGETLSRESIYGQKKNIFELDDDFIRSFEAIEGKTLVSGIRQGECITASLVAFPPLIRKGDIVSLIARNDSLMIVTTGICREGGSKNDVIKVENMNSGKIIRGIVKEKSKVEVIY